MNGKLEGMLKRWPVAKGEPPYPKDPAMLGSCWPLTLQTCTGPHAKEIAERILMLPTVRRWVNAPCGRDKDLRDRRACTLISVAHCFVANANTEMQTPGAHRKHFTQWAVILERLARRLRAEADHPLRGSWLGVGTDPDVIRAAGAASAAQPAIAAIVRNAAEEGQGSPPIPAALTAAADFVFPEALQAAPATIAADYVSTAARNARTLASGAPALTAKRVGRHGALNDFIRAMGEWIKAENGGIPDHVLVADVTAALNEADPASGKVSLIDSTDDRVIDAAVVECTVRYGAKPPK